MSAGPAAARTHGNPLLESPVRVGCPQALLPVPALPGAVPGKDHATAGRISKLLAMTGAGFIVTSSGQRVTSGSPSEIAISLEILQAGAPDPAFSCGRNSAESFLATKSAPSRASVLDCGGPPPLC